MKRLLLAVALVAALCTAGCGQATTTTTTTQAGPSPVELQKQVCPDPEPASAYKEQGRVAEPTVTPACVAALSAGQLEGAYTAPPPSLLGARAPPLTTYANGQFPSSAIAPATGCSVGLANSAAAAWNHVAVIVHEHTGYWLQSNGSVSCYRTYQQQVDLRRQWCNAGNCNNAAVPGTSNHGWGIAVDAPSQTVSYIHQYSGGLFGQGYGSCSDAPWEGWHVKYCGGYSGSDPGPYGSGGGGGGFHTLKHGSKGDRVRKLQTHLFYLHNIGTHAGYLVKWSDRTGFYGDHTRHAVIKLQHDGNLTRDGKYGPKTAAYQVKRWHYFCHAHPNKEACK